MAEWNLENLENSLDGIEETVDSLSMSVVRLATQMELVLRDLLALTTELRGGSGDRTPLLERMAKAEVQHEDLTRRMADFVQVLDNLNGRIESFDNGQKTVDVERARGSWKVLLALVTGASVVIQGIIQLIAAWMGK